MSLLIQLSLTDLSGRTSDGLPWTPKASAKQQNKNVIAFLIA
jgi:hypothetical protein